MTTRGALNDKTKIRIMERDGFTCQGCKVSNLQPSMFVEDWVGELEAGGNFLVVDHIDPKGGNEDANLQTLCWRCNSSKAGRSHELFTLSMAIQRLGRPVAFYPFIARLIGFKEALLLCQLIYWTPRGRHGKGAGWIYKSSDELEAETAIPYAAQLRARKRLVKMGLLEETHERDEHIVYFRVCTSGLDLLAETYGEHLTNCNMPVPVDVEEHLTKRKVAPNNLQGGTLQNGSSYKETETTTETTTVIPTTESYPEGNYKTFRQRFYTETGVTPGKEKTLRAVYAKLTVQFGEDAVLEFIGEWVRSRGGRKFDERDAKWAAKNFIEAAEDILEAKKNTADNPAVSAQRPDPNAGRELTEAGRKVLERYKQGSG